MYLEEWCGASGMKLLSICFASFTMSPNSAITVAIRSSGVCWNVDDVCCKVSTIPYETFEHLFRFVYDVSEFRHYRCNTV